VKFANILRCSLGTELRFRGKGGNLATLTLTRCTKLEPESTTESKKLTTRQKVEEKIRLKPSWKGEINVNKSKEQRREKNYIALEWRTRPQHKQQWLICQNLNQMFVDGLPTSLLSSDRAGWSYYLGYIVIQCQWRLETGFENWSRIKP
jgi:hypothetical protein